MKKIIISVIIIAGIALYFWLSNSSNNLPVIVTNMTPGFSPLPTTASTPTSGGSTPNPTSRPIATSRPTATPRPTQNSSGLVDGIYTSPVEDALYGSLQFKVAISGGRISDVQYLQYPQGGHSSEVSSFALPTLKQEAIQSQSANVDIVSGATQTSEAFIRAMGSVLSQARG